MLHQTGFGVSHVAKAAEFSLLKKYPHFPQLPRSSQQAQSTSSGSKSPLLATAPPLAPDSVLVYATQGIKGIDLFFSGSCYLGRIPLDSTVLAAFVTPSTNLGLFCTSGKDLVYQEIETEASSPATEMLARSSTAMHSYLSHIYEALAEPLALFQDALDVSMRWCNRISVTSEDHGGRLLMLYHLENLRLTTGCPVNLSVEHQLMLMLLDGKHTPPMLEVFTSKLSERVRTRCCCI